MNIHKNARLTPHSRAEWCGGWWLRGRRRRPSRPLRRPRKTVRKWVARFQAEGVAGLQDRSSRPHRLHRPTPAATVATDRSPAPPALDRQADRSGSRRLAGDGQPRPPAPRPQSHPGARTGRAGSPLRARAARRTDPYRHQKARPLRPGRPSHHRRPHRPKQEPRHRLGVRPCLHRRRLAPGLLADPARREEGERRRLPQGRRRLLLEASASRWRG